MSTIFEYSGIFLRIYSGEHLPIHVHALYGDKYRMKVEFLKQGEKIVKIEYKIIKGFKAFPPAQMDDLKTLINKYQYDIVNDWITFIINHSRVQKRKITVKIR